MPDAPRYVRCPECGHEGPPESDETGRMRCMQCGSVHVGAIPLPHGQQRPARRWWQPVLGVLVYGGIFLGIPMLFLLLLVWGFLQGEPELDITAQPPALEQAPPAPVLTPPARIFGDNTIIETTHCIGVLNGHTLLVADRQKPAGQEVRLQAVTTPDVNTRLGIEVATFVRDLALNRKVRLTMHRSRLGDPEGLLLANVEVLTDGGAVLTDLEEILLRRGFAWVSALPQSTDRLEELRMLEEDARQRRVGIWASAPDLLVPPGFSPTAPR